MHGLFGLAVNAEQAVTIVLAVVCTALVVGLLLRKDTAKEMRRRAVNVTVAKLRSEGLGDLADILEAYVVGDYSDLVQSAVEFAKLAGDVEKFDALLLRHFKMQLPARLEDPEVGRWIVETVDAWKAAKAAQVTPAVAAMAAQGSSALAS